MSAGPAGRSAGGPCVCNAGCVVADHDNYCLTRYGHEVFDKNIDLSHKLAHHFRVPMGMTFEDWQQEVHKVFTRAIALHDPAKGELSTLAFRLVFLRWSNLNTRHRTRFQGRATASMDRGDDCNMTNLFGVEHDGFRHVDDRELVDKVMEATPPRYRKVLQLLAEGVSARRIGDELGYSDQYGTQSLAIVREKAIAVLGFDHVRSDSYCDHCGDPVVHMSVKSTTRRCPACIRERLLAKKRKDFHRRTAK